MYQFNIIKIFVYILNTLILFGMTFIIKGAVLRNITADIKNPIFELDYITNTGAAFSIFSGSNYFLAIFGFIAIFFIVSHLCYNSYSTSYLKVVLFSIFTAGITANLFERLRYGFVTDYINLKLFPFPIFNFQDILIVASAVGLIFLYLFEKNKKKINTLTKEILSPTETEDNAE